MLTGAAFWQPYLPIARWRVSRRERKTLRDRRFPIQVSFIHGLTVGWPVLHLISRISPPCTESGAFRRADSEFLVGLKLFWIPDTAQDDWNALVRFLLHLLHVANVIILLSFTLFDPFDKNTRLKCQTRRVPRPALVPRLATRVLRWSRNGKTSHQDRSMVASWDEICQIMNRTWLRTNSAYLKI